MGFWNSISTFSGTTDPIIAHDLKSVVSGKIGHRFEEIQLKIQQNGLLFPLDVLLVGGTGTGKSSTLNAIFESTVAKVGDGVDPETMTITSHSLHKYLRFHDSAGLGDGKAADYQHAKNITAKLLETCTANEQRYGFIDLVIVLLDGGSRDLGTTFSLLESVVLKSVEPERVIVAINCADIAMKGRHWNVLSAKPEPILRDFLDEKATSVQRRIMESTGLSIKRPVYYSALCNYNLAQLFDHIISHIPKSRRNI